MVKLHDILAHIAQVTGAYTGLSLDAAMADSWKHYPYRVRMAITTDVEFTEEDYLKRYGQNETVYFSLRDYQHGCELARELFRTLTGTEPDMTHYTGKDFSVFDKLYLFVYIQIIPKDIAIC